MMHMTFYWGKEVTILFTSWKTTTWPNYALSLLACFIAPVLYQLLENQRIRIKLAAAAAGGKSSASPDGIGTPLLLQSNISGEKWAAAAKMVGAVLFGINSAIGYLLMLAVMSFNGGVFIAVVLGLAVGYLFFRSDDGELNVVDNPCACA